MPVSSSSTDDSRPDEWKEARSVVDAVDTRLTDLRKYGLTFVAGLLTAQGLTEVAVGSPASYVTPIVKLAITAVSLLIICMMVAVEKVNLPIQRGAALRASVLERQLGLELTEDITTVYAWYDVTYWLFGLYLAFVVSVGLFGLAILIPVSFNLSWEVPTEIGAFAAASAFVFVEWLLTPKPRMVDWSLDRYRCKEGETLQLMVTNFTGYRIGAALDYEIWLVERTPEGIERNYKWNEADKDQPLGKGESRVWPIDTTGLPPDSYYLQVARPGKKLTKVTPRAPPSTGSSAPGGEKAPHSESVTPQAPPSTGSSAPGGEKVPHPESYRMVCFDHRERLPVPIVVIPARSKSHSQHEVWGEDIF